MLLAKIVIQTKIERIVAQQLIILKQIFEKSYWKKKK